MLAELVTLVLILGTVAAVVNAPGTKATLSTTTGDTDYSPDGPPTCPIDFCPHGTPPCPVDYFPDGAPTCRVAGLPYTNILVNNRVDTGGHAH